MSTEGIDPLPECDTRSPDRTFRREDKKSALTPYHEPHDERRDRRPQQDEEIKSKGAVYAAPLFLRLG